MSNKGKIFIVIAMVSLFLSSAITYAEASNVLFASSTYCAQGSDVLDITTEDFEISFWMRQNGDPGQISIITGFFSILVTVKLR